MPAGKTKDLRPPFAQLLANSVTVPGPEIRRVQEAAAAADVGLAFSVNEINGSGSVRPYTIP